MLLESEMRLELYMSLSISNVTKMTCRGPFRGAQGHDCLRNCAGEGTSWVGSVAKWLTVIDDITVLLCCCITTVSSALGGWMSKIPFGTAQSSFWGAGGGWVLVGWTGLVLPTTAQIPARLVYGSCACGFPQGTAEPLRHASNNSTHMKELPPSRLSLQRG